MIDDKAVMPVLQVEVECPGVTTEETTSFACVGSGAGVTKGHKPPCTKPHNSTHHTEARDSVEVK